MTTTMPEVATCCAYCGRPISPEGGAPERFGERFCSESHAEEFVAGARAARIEKAAHAEDGASRVADGGGTGDLTTQGQQGWRDSMKRAVCWGAPLLVLLAIPLFWTGGWAATGGSLLTVLAFLACPLGMYFMMRGMMNMQQDSRSPAERRKEDGDA